MENKFKAFDKWWKENGFGEKKWPPGCKETWKAALCWVCKLHQTRLTSDVIKTIIAELGYDPTENKQWKTE